MEKKDAHNKQSATESDLTSSYAEPFEIRAHHLLCAICRRGGCPGPSSGRRKIDRLMKAVWGWPYLSLQITADVDLNRAHYLDVYANRGNRPLPKDFWKRQKDYVGRKKDFETLRRMGIVPNTILPAYLAYEIIFSRIRTLEGICFSSFTLDSKTWSECPYARKGYYEKIVSQRRYGLKEQTELGEEMSGKGIWSLFSPRTRKDMMETKRTSSKHIRHADRLFIRPSHLLCILCTADLKEPLIQDNLVELRTKMEENPSIPVTLIEGCCMVCDPCNVYHPYENVCYRAHIKNQLRDLMMLEKLDLKPGDTLSAKDLYERIHERIGSLREICAWGDEQNTAIFWAPCGSWKTNIEGKLERFPWWNKARDSAKKMNVSP